jgi:hypothetical protein
MLRHTPTKPTAEVMKTVTQILEQYRPKIRELVMKAGMHCLTRVWIPKVNHSDPSQVNFREAIKSLDIPEVLGHPSLLLHELAGVIDNNQEEAIANIFSLYDHSCAHSFALLGLSNFAATVSLSIPRVLVKLV